MNHIHEPSVKVHKSINESAHTLHNNNIATTIWCITKIVQKSQNFEPTNETRNSDKTLRMMSPIHYGIAPSIHGEHISVQY